MDRQLLMGGRGGHGPECGIHELKWILRKEEMTESLPMDLIYL